MLFYTIAILIIIICFIFLILGKNNLIEGVSFGTLPSVPINDYVKSELPYEWNYGENRHHNPVLLNSDKQILTVPYLSQSMTNPPVFSSPLEKYDNVFFPPKVGKYINRYELLGYVYREKNANMYKLFGQRINNTRYMYYVIDDERKMRIELKYSNLPELLDGDKIELQGIRGKFTVKLYDINFPRYMI